MFINDDNTHEVNLKDGVSVLRNIYGYNAAANPVLISKTIDTIAENNFQSSVMVPQVNCSPNSSGSGEKKNNNKRKRDADDK